MSPGSFADRLLRWFDAHGRHDLPWQHPREAYRVWLSEIMLQQTQVATVIPYFERFVARFPDVRTLAGADIDDVLALWSGLGYYARARNLHRCAQVVVREHGGAFPRSHEALAALPGIGRSTAGAILAQAFDMRAPILDGNVRRVLARHAAVDGWPGAPAVQKRLWALADSLLPRSRHADYAQALMDLGATMCTARNPACNRCPLVDDCVAFSAGTVARYPQTRPRKARPLRRVRLLLASNGRGELLLERRAPVGIWGGLWCPPLLDDERLASGAWVAALLDQTMPQVSGPPVRHGFTHFELEMQPLQVIVEARHEIAEPERWRWVRLTDLADVGLPAPVRKLIATRHLP